MITSKVIFDRETLQQLPKLKLIAITATGTNNVDLVAAEEMGIAVRNVTGYSSTTVPEHVIGLIFFFKTQFGRLVTLIKRKQNGRKVNNFVILIIQLQMCAVQRWAYLVKVA